MLLCLLVFYLLTFKRFIVTTYYFTKYFYIWSSQYVLLTSYFTLNSSLMVHSVEMSSKYFCFMCCMQCRINAMSHHFITHTVSYSYIQTQWGEKCNNSGFQHPTLSHFMITLSRDCDLIEDVTSLIIQPYCIWYSQS